jgi:hypothetical protein
MADNVTLNSMSGGSVVATDDAGAGGQVQIVKLAYSADGDRTHIPATAAGLAVIERGATIASTSASVTTTTGAIASLPSTTGRRSIVITNLGTDYVFIGASGVGVNQGIRLAPGQALTIDKSPNAAVHAIAATGTQTVAIFTESD